MSKNSDQENFYTKILTFKKIQTSVFLHKNFLGRNFERHSIVAMYPSNYENSLSKLSYPLPTGCRKAKLEQIKLLQCKNSVHETQVIHQHKHGTLDYVAMIILVLWILISRSINISFTIKLADPCKVTFSQIKMWWLL